MAPRALPDVLDRREGVKGALLYTLPGRAIVIGLAIRLTVALATAIVGPLPTFVRVVDTVAGIAIASGAVYFAFRLVGVANRLLLWRVRRKLILSYFFIGFVPAGLIVLFFLLCGYLLFYNLGSYLVQTRLRGLGEQARSLAQSTALEIQRTGGRDAASIIQRRQLNTSAQYPDISFALLSGRYDCGYERQKKDEKPAAAPVTVAAASGPWAHAEPPTAIPTWLPCPSFAGVLAYTHQRSGSPQDEDTHLLVRGVAFAEGAAPAYAVVVDVLVNDRVRDELRRETGVQLKNVTWTPPEKILTRPMRGRDGQDKDRDARAGLSGMLSHVPTVMEFRDWDSGEAGFVTTFTALSASEMYERISASEGKGRSLGQGLLLILFFIGALFLIIEFAALVAGLALARSITGSVHELFAGTERVRQGDFTHKIAVTSEDQLGELASSFNSMTASIEDLLVQSAEKKRLEEELRIAHEIQMSLLPQGPLVMPGLSVTALCVPAREVGGDYYDFLPLDEHRLGVLIADVSGKGTSAALYMAELKGLVLSLSEIHTSPRELLIAANRIIANHLDSRSFITMTYAIVDMRERTITYARAGHTPLIYVSGPQEGRRMQVLAPDGLVLGLKIDNGELFQRLLEEETLPLRPGDLYLFFTDGISEAMNVHDDCFGENRLGQLVESHAHLPSDQLRERVLREIAAFVGEAPQHDDMTMILLKVDEMAAGAAIDAEYAELAK